MLRDGLSILDENLIKPIFSSTFSTRRAVIDFAAVGYPKKSPTLVTIAWKKGRSNIRLYMRHIRYGRGDGDPRLRTVIVRIESGLLEETNKL